MVVGSKALLTGGSLVLAVILVAGCGELAPGVGSPGGHAPRAAQDVAAGPTPALAAEAALVGQTAAPDDIAQVTKPEPDDSHPPDEGSHPKRGHQPQGTPSASPSPSASSSAGPPVSQGKACSGNPAPGGGRNLFSQADIDAAVATAPLAFSAPSLTSRPGTGPVRVYRSKAMYYLALVDCVDPGAVSSGGVTASRALLRQVQSVITGGSEPSASGDLEGWSHNAVAQALLLVRHESNVWGSLSGTQRGKVDDLMEAMGVGGNWGYNDANDFRTGIGQFGNFRKTSNANYREGYVGVEIAVIEYFGAVAWDQMLSNFSYDAFVARLSADGFTNITGSWAHAGRALMESGGVDSFKGHGVGVKLPFVYMGHHSTELTGIYGALAAHTWGLTVTSTVSGSSGGSALTAHIADNSTSPFEGQLGMEQEFQASDRAGLRSDALYAYEGFMNSLATRTTMFVMGEWGCGVTQSGTVHREAVGIADLMYKLQHGYYGASLRSTGALVLVNASTPASDGPDAKGYLFDRDIWLHYTSRFNTAC